MRHVRKLSLAFTLLVGCAGNDAPTAPNATPVDPSIPPPGGMATNGRLVRTRYDVTGTASLTIANGVGLLELSSDYSIVQTPDPVLYINTTNNPNTGTPLRIASLKGKSGAQRYTFTVPAGVRYTWIIIWCDPFNVPMAEASIAPTP
jgi:hypothetical protein